MASSVSFTLTPQPPVNQEWISPEEQLERLSLYIAKKISDVSGLIFPIAHLVAKYGEIDDSAMEWHRALVILAQTNPKVFPQKIPPLPTDIFEILYSRCLISRDKKKPDGTFFKIKESHVLSLILEEFGTLAQLEKDILKPFGEANYPQNENPFHFRSFENLCGNQQTAPMRTHWVLMSKDVLPGTKGKGYRRQEALVDSLSRKSLVAYRIPTLLQTFATFAIHKIATGESLYSDGNVSTYTRVTDLSRRNGMMSFGGSAPSGVCTQDFLTGDDLGAAVLRYV